MINPLAFLVGDSSFYRIHLNPLFRLLDERLNEPAFLIVDSISQALVVPDLYFGGNWGHLLVDHFFNRLELLLVDVHSPHNLSSHLSPLELVDLSWLFELGNHWSNHLLAITIFDPAQVYLYLPFYWLGEELDFGTAIDLQEH